MKYLLTFIFSLGVLFASSQTPMTTYGSPSIANMKTYSGQANRIHVYPTNTDYINNPLLTADEITVFAGVGGRKWKLQVPQSVSDNLAIKANQAALLDSAAAIRATINIPTNLGVGLIFEDDSLKVDVTDDNLLAAFANTNASLLTSGTLPDARLSSNVAQLTGPQTFTGVKTFTTPILGTPTSVTLTNATGLPVSTGLSGLGTGVATFLGTPSSANLIAAVTNETGTGALVFGTSPTVASPTFSGTIAGTYTIGGTPTFPSSVTQNTSTQTLTNKRWTARVGSTTSSATPTINTDNVDIYKITAQTVDITSFTTNLTGTPVDGDILEIQITGTAARAITWGASFVASTVALPTTTTGTATLTVVYQYFTTSSYGNNKWVCASTF